MVPELEWDDAYVPDHGKVLGAEELEKMDKFYRYLDVDGDGIPYRTLPGTHPKGSYFTRGSGHTKYGAYTENSADYQEVLDRLLVKWETARAALPAPEIEFSKFNKAGLITIGSGDGACRAAGLDDQAILELNQVVAYFNYANRTVQGLGVDTAGDILGLSPDGAGWQHR